MLLEATKGPGDEYALGNVVVASATDFPDSSSQTISVPPIYPGGQASPESYLFSIVTSSKVPPGRIGLAGHQRKWSQVAIGQQLQVALKNIDATCTKAGIELGFFKDSDAKKHGETSFDSDQMSNEFSQKFNSKVFSVGQPFIFEFNKLKFNAKIVGLEAISHSNLRKTGNMRQESVMSAIISGNTQIQFSANANSPLMLSGNSQNLKSSQNMIINPDFDFAQMGIGGLGEEFKEIFRRAFASRIFPPDIVAKMGGKHVKGILLHGPPGCGKTLMARKIGKMLSSREPQVVNGPEILNKYVGESEANVRKLFEPAEEEQKRLGKKIRTSYHHF